LLGLPLALGSIFVGGIVGALATLWLILMLSKKLSSDYLILVGVAIGALMNGVLSLINLAGDPRLQSILSWLSGTTYSARPETVWWLIGFAIILVTCGWLLI
ncbi:iron chelate uptake ABC transporter family permease subunit, partial [Mycobacterium tuberculosis]|nr:iron chelate uptake ABC transporter family permease subunit [Mycobacterium tuberculosis]